MSWNRLPDEQPSLTARLSFRSGKATVRAHVTDQCRDFLRGSIEDSLTEDADLSHPSCHAPYANYLECQTFMRARSFEEMIFVTDVIAGLPGIIVSDDRYEGDWCLTTEEDARKFVRSGNTSYPGDVECRNFRWYGIDNCPLISPAIFYLTTGLFRQAVRMYEEELEEGIYGLVGRAEVNRAMETSDKEFAWHLLQRVKPFLVGRGTSDYLPLGNDRWRAFEYIYKASQGRSVMDLFGKNVCETWDLEQKNLYGSPKGWMSFARGHASNRKKVTRG